jgi:7-carboxy-7-deazaguanine synthase
MYLVEEFYSIQGEGKYIGTPSIFLRFGGCNLKCSGFNSTLISNFNVIKGCDSIQAVNKKHFSNKWKKIKDVNELVQIINKYQEKLLFKPHIVLTGGEPLIYHKNKIFYNLISILKEYKITIETNASIKINFNLYPNYKNITFAMSVKLANSNELQEKRVNHNAIKSIISNTKDSFFKFVVDKNYIDEFENSEISLITKEYDNLIYCMPMGESIESLTKNDKAVIEFCKKNGYIYSDRIHIRIYGKQRGV